MREPLPAHERARDPRRGRAACSRNGTRRRRGRSPPRPASRSRRRASRRQRAVSTFTFAAVEARKLAGEVVPMDASPAGEGKLAFTLRLPIGIVGAISPFNFPLNLVAHKVAPALAAGCAVVLKPASATPLSALLLAELEEEAGLPPGWLNVVAGLGVGDRRRARRGRAREADHVHRLGRRRLGLAERAPRKRVKLELGNATPAIVCATPTRERGGEARGERVLVRGAELHLGAAHLRRGRRAGTRSSRDFVPSRGADRSATRPTTRPTSGP